MSEYGIFCPMLLMNLVETSRRVTETSRRLEKIYLLAGLLRQAGTDEIEPAVAFLSGRATQGRIGIGYATLREAAGGGAEQATLELAEVDGMLGSLARVSGRGSEARRRELLGTLFARATPAEQSFLTGLLLGEIRQGALEGVMVEALAKAFEVSPERMRRAVMMTGDAARVAKVVVERGACALDECVIQLFRPVQPMLAQTAEDVDAALLDLGEAALEYKFDGARVQVHRSGDDVVVFSRALNDVTQAVPEVVEAVRAMPGRDMILEGEVLSMTPEGRPRPFQVTMRRFGRKLDVEAMRQELPLTPFWFDLLYLNGQPVLDEAQRRRFGALAELAPAETLVPHLVTGHAEQGAEFLKEALERGHEGIMAKSVDASYAAGSRGQNWLKIKKATTLDLVILAAEWGNGRRQGWLSNLHLGARDVEKGGFAMLGKTFKGLTDEMLKWQTEELLKLEMARDKYTVYVHPKLVAEIAFSDIQVSPRYVSGLALRFARVKRYRPDKSAEDADTFQTVQKLAAEAL